MALSLAEKLGAKGLRAYSLHPGVIATNIGAHMDWSVDLAEMSTLPDHLLCVLRASRLTSSAEATDKALGNWEGFEEGFRWKTDDQGIATHVFAAFHPSLEGEQLSFIFRFCLAGTFFLTLGQTTTAHTSRTPTLPTRGPRQSNHGPPARWRRKDCGS